MKKILLFLLTIMGSTALFCQENITLTFTGHDGNQNYVRLDSVRIDNLTRGWSETIYYPDTIYLLNENTGISDHTNDKGIIVMPNPFDGITHVNIHSSKIENVRINLTDMMGHICADYCGLLSEGGNIFNICVSVPQTYVLSVQNSTGIRSIKLENIGHANTNRIVLVGTAPYTRQLKQVSSYAFLLGDEMRYQGYASSRVSYEVRQGQYSDEQIIFVFDTHGNACPGAPTLTDIEGNVYNTVQIGTQCWMKDNLRTTHYANNTEIPVGDTNIYSGTEPYCYIPNNDESNVVMYGYLYNWPAMMHGDSSSSANPSGVQGICPSGWHVPSDAEWSQLTAYVCSQSEFVCVEGENYHANIAKAMASTTGWLISSYLCAPGKNQSANNATGFSALPAGSFQSWPRYFGSFSHYWSATESSSSVANSRTLGRDNSQVARDGELKGSAWSVRCVRD